MFSGELIVAGKRGLIGETISMVSICLPFPQGRADLSRCPYRHLRDATAREHEKISIRISSIYIAPATAAFRKKSDDYFHVFLRHTSKPVF